jgi:L-asparaginase
VITGSQRPLAEIRSDARMNIVDSVQLACLGFAEVFVCFNSDVFLASRASKVSNLDLAAFHSPNFPKLGHFGVEILLNELLLPTKSSASNMQEFAKLIIDTRTVSQVFCMGIVPGLHLEKSLRVEILKSSNALLLEGFGLGHAPTANAQWLSLVQEAKEAQIPVVMTSQCRSGHVDMSLYEVGKEFANRGVISSFDMTRECATIKLMMLLGRKIAFEDRHDFMTTPLSREISKPSLEILANWHDADKEYP